MDQEIKPINPIQIPKFDAETMENEVITQNVIRYLNENILNLKIDDNFYSDEDLKNNYFAFMLPASLYSLTQKDQEFIHKLIVSRYKQAGFEDCSIQYGSVRGPHYNFMIHKKYFIRPIIEKI